MKILSRRAILASALLVSLLPTSALFAAEKPSAITIDWATYNPVSMVLKEKGWLEEEFKKDGIAIRRSPAQSMTRSRPTCRVRATASRPPSMPSNGAC